MGFGFYLFQVQEKAIIVSDYDTTYLFGRSNGDLLFNIWSAIEELLFSNRLIRRSCFFIRVVLSFRFLVSFSNARLISRVSPANVI